MRKNAIRTQMFNANICILCDVVKKVERSWEFGVVFSFDRRYTGGKVYVDLLYSFY